MRDVQDGKKFRPLSSHPFSISYRCTALVEQRSPIFAAQRNIYRYDGVKLLFLAVAVNVVDALLDFSSLQSHHFVSGIYINVV